MKKLIIFILAMIIAVFFYETKVTNQKIDIREYSIYSESLPKGFDGIKIVHFSDLLYDSNTDLEKIKTMINEANADIIVFTGNIFKNSNITEENKEKVQVFFKELNANLYKYAIIGSKDSKDITNIYEESNFILLDNQNQILYKNDMIPIQIIGGNNIEPSIYDTEKEHKFNIILIHEPDYFDSIDYPEGYSLVLVGHSLGGQIRLPFYGALIKEKGAQKYTDSVYTHENKSLFVNFGLGTDKIRIFNVPTINVYRIYAK